MKKKKLSGKLNLNKVTISKLDASEIKGGRPVTTIFYTELCDTDATLQQCPTHQVGCRTTTNLSLPCQVSVEIVCIP
jgi:hypothetical protein